MFLSHLYSRECPDSVNMHPLEPAVIREIGISYKEQGTTGRTGKTLYGLPPPICITKVKLKIALRKNAMELFDRRKSPLRDLFVQVRLEIINSPIKKIEKVEKEYGCILESRKSDESRRFA